MATKKLILSAMDVVLAKIHDEAVSGRKSRAMESVAQSCNKEFGLGWPEVRRKIDQQIRRLFRFRWARSADVFIQNMTVGCSGHWYIDRLMEVLFLHYRMIHLFQYHGVASWRELRLKDKRDNPWDYHPMPDLLKLQPEAFRPIVQELDDYRNSREHHDLYFTLLSVAPHFRLSKVRQALRSHGLFPEKEWAEGRYNVYFIPSHQYEQLGWADRRLVATNLTRDEAIKKAKEISQQEQGKDSRIQNQKVIPYPQEVKPGHIDITIGYEVEGRPIPDYVCQVQLADWSH